MPFLTDPGRVYESCERRSICSGLNFLHFLHHLHFPCWHHHHIEKGRAYVTPYWPPRIANDCLFEFSNTPRRSGPETRIYILNSDQHSQESQRLDSVQRENCMRNRFKKFKGRNLKRAEVKALKGCLFLTWIVLIYIEKCFSHEGMLWEVGGLVVCQTGTLGSNLNVC